MRKILVLKKRKKSLISMLLLEIPLLLVFDKKMAKNGDKNMQTRDLLRNVFRKRTYILIVKSKIQYYMNICRRGFHFHSAC